jgi:hypothetical protein
VNKSRTVTCYYEDAAGEHAILVTLYRDGLGHNDVIIETDLSDVPDDEIEGVKQRALDEFSALERAEYLLSPAAERNGD